MSKRIALRDAFVALVKTLPGFGGHNVRIYKLDRVDKTPFCSVHLGSMTSGVETMMRDGHQVSRSLSVFVDFHLDSSDDADKTMDAWLAELETGVMQAAKNGDIPGIRTVSLERAVFHPVETGFQQRGDLVTEWRADFDEFIPLS